MRFSEEKLKTVYATVTRVDKLNLGYDLTAENGPDGQTVQVEVKGQATEDNAVLTGNETTAADTYKNSFYLCVVFAIPQSPAMYMVQNPAEPGKGKKDKLTILPNIWKSFKWP